MKRRAPERATTTEVPPAALLVGPCVEVWAAPGADLAVFNTLMDGWQRWGRARASWVAARNLGDAEGYRLLPDGAPWRLGDPGTDARLAAAGITRDDVDALRAEAARL